MRPSRAPHSVRKAKVRNDLDEMLAQAERTREARKESFLDMLADTIARKRAEKDGE